MFGQTRWSPFEEMFRFQREVDRVFNQFWSDLPSRTTAEPGHFQVNATDDGWRINVPLPGVAPEHVALEVAGHTLTIRAQVPGEQKGQPAARYEQSVTLPQFLDTEKITASQRYGMLQLTVPLKASVRPRRIEIETQPEEHKQLTSA